MSAGFLDVMFRLPAAYEPRTSWPPLAALAAAFVVFVVSTLGSLAALGAMTGLLGVSMPTVENPGGTQMRILVLALLVQQALMILATLFFAERFDARGAAVLAIDRWPRRLGVFLGAFGLMAALLVGLDVVGWLLGPHNVTGDLKPFAKMIGSDSWWLTLLAVGVGAPLSEELLFRGFLFSALARTRLGVPGASLLTTAAWAALHGNYSAFGVFEVGVIGLFLSWLLWRTGSLWVPIFCHAVYNSALTALLAFVPLPAT